MTNDIVLVNYDWLINNLKIARFFIQIANCKTTTLAQIKCIQNEKSLVDPSRLEVCDYILTLFVFLLSSIMFVE